MPSKHLLLASTLLSSVVLGAPMALAQETSPGEAAAVGELVVTGTRLRLPDYVLPNPVVSVGSAEIEASGDTNLTDFLTDIPALVSSVDDVRGADQTTPGLVGLNLLDLRNLGEDRTLVLVNGRRHVSGDPGTAAVDINTIPMDLVERVDVQTGGYSAIYGADAVSGVVNFILKDDYEGLSTHSQLGFAEHGGGATRFTSVLWGKNFNERRGNITLQGEYYNRDDVKFFERDFTRPGKRKIFVGNPAEVDQSSAPPGDIHDDPSVPDRILASGATYIDTSPEGSVIVNADQSFSFLADGRPFIQATQTGAFIGIGGSGSLLDLYNDDLLPGSERFAVNAIGHYDLNDKATLFGELKFVRTNSDFVGQPSYDYGLFVPLDNPRLPASAVAAYNALVDAGDDEDVVGGLLNLSREEGGFGLNLPDGVLIARDNFDLRSITWDIARETTRGVVGVRGNLTDNISYETSLNYGFSSQTQKGSNVRINERFFAATDFVDDGTGNLVCRSNLDPTAIPTGDLFAQFPFDQNTFGTTFTPGADSGCVAADIFGVGNLSKEAIDWINTKVTERSRISQFVWNGYISGTTDNYFTIPTGGPLGFVLGAEYRKETSRYNPDAIELLSEELQYPLTVTGRAANTRGEFSVSEAFAELSLPLLKDKPFAQDLTLLSAYRYSDYSTAGETDTWSAGLQYRPVQDIMFRGTRARAVRAPNIVDLFAGRSQTFESFADPCDFTNLNLGENPALRKENCAIDLAAAGHPTPDRYQDTSSEAVGGFIGGNPNLRPEEADTTTYGLVFTPRLIPGLSISADYYLIKIRDAVQSFSAATIVNNCYDLPRPNDFCDLITRQQGGTNPGRLSGFEQLPGNLATYKTSGYDVTIRYRIDPSRYGVERDIGIFNTSLVLNFLEDLQFAESSGAVPTEDDGDRRANNSAAPELQATFDLTWDKGPWSVNYGFSYFDETRRIGEVTRMNEPDIVERRYYDYKARHEHDLQVSYQFMEKYQVYGGVNNFTDQKPDPDDYIYPVSPLGRFFYVGLKTTWR